MKKLIMIVLFTVLLVGAAFGQNTLPVEKVDGVKSLGSQRYGAVIWDNFAASGWFSSMTTGYMWLDWGKLLDAGNQMPDEVIDGFGFSYATDATIGGISWNMYYYDSCTGWGDYAIVQEAGFAFTGLPDATNLPPGYFWGWLLWVDLEETGYEFLMGYDIGVGHSLQTPGITCGPRLTKPPLVGGNGNTLTEDAFDIIDSAGNIVGSYWFGGYPANPYASFCAQLMGGSDPSTNTNYAGIPLQGNNTSLYCVGTWAYGSYNNFLLRMNGIDHNAIRGGVFFNYIPLPTYWPNYGITTVPLIPGCNKIPFSLSYTGDYVIYPFHCGAGAAAFTWYIQGVISNWLIGGSVAPIEMSMDCVIT